METFRKDLKLAIRMLTKSPGFTTMAVVTLALGIAVNTTMFSLMSAFFLQRPPGQDPEHIVVVTSTNAAQAFQGDVAPVSAPNYLALRGANQVFTDMAAADQYRSASLTGQGEPEPIRSAAVSPNYFSVLGVTPELGRTFASGEDQAGRDHVVILSH